MRHLALEVSGQTVYYAKYMKTNGMPMHSKNHQEENSVPSELTHTETRVREQAPTLLPKHGLVEQWKVPEAHTTERLGRCEPFP